MSRTATAILKTVEMRKRVPTSIDSSTARNVLLKLRRVETSSTVTPKQILRSVPSVPDGTSTNCNANDKVTVEILIDIINSESGQPSKFAAPNGKSNVILKIGEQKLHVSKEYLAQHSPVFDKLFFGRRVKKGKEEVELKDVDYEEFVDLLNVVYLERQEIDDFKVEHILKLADRFQMKCIFEHCVQHLVESSEIEAVQKLSIAEQYNLPYLTSRCLKSFKSATLLTEKLMASPEAADFSAEMKAAIIDRMLQLKQQ